MVACRHGVPRAPGVRGSGDRQLLKQLVHRLRQKLERAAPGNDPLQTEPGVGYRLKA